jgi:hypothetical protein
MKVGDKIYILRAYVYGCWTDYVFEDVAHWGVERGSHRIIAKEKQKGVLHFWAARRGEARLVNSKNCFTTLSKALAEYKRRAKITYEANVVSFKK